MVATEYRSKGLNIDLSINSLFNNITKVTNIKSRISFDSLRNCSLQADLIESFDIGELIKISRNSNDITCMDEARRVFQSKYGEMTFIVRNSLSKIERTWFKLINEKEVSLTPSLAY